MADAGSTKVGTPRSSARCPIAVHSKHALDKLVNGVTSAIQEVIGKLTDLDDEQKEHLNIRYTEIYQNIIHDNVLINGKSWHEAEDVNDDTVEFEPLDMDLQRTVDQQILEIDDTIVSLTKKRKKYPKKITQCLRDVHNCYQRMLEEYKPEIPQQVIGEESRLDPTVEAQMMDRISSVSKSASVLMKKSLQDTVAKLERTTKAVEMQQSIEKSKTIKVLEKPMDPDVILSASLTPLKKMLEETPTPPPAKKAKGLKRELNYKKLHTHSITDYNLRCTTIKRKLRTTPRRTVKYTI
ncbi:uncharacterized protein LOC100374068 [Saccoglossus kowalevskii]|uniref:Uncharacterized protein LOC100374068 n=1 Tax=Saccoglossus kowalevskii TaxID=10224 RepID=A0ABM0GM66_SACKO|nr:PREDICTED: uncharacterized protein LOC100374068 [Saccoglossus kowalevskii]